MCGLVGVEEEISMSKPSAPMSHRGMSLLFRCSLKFLGFVEGGAICKSNFGKGFNFRPVNYFPK